MEEHLTEGVTRLVFALAVILFLAKVAGEVCERYLKVPPVLGELVTGVIIGPYALGAVNFPGIGVLFPIIHSLSENVAVIPVSSELWALAQIGAVVLLFSAGLETDVGRFLRYSGPAVVVAIGGVVFPFLAGVFATVLFGFADTLLDPTALFMGAVMTATSVGITARVMNERQKLDTPEGVTILGAAVIDDVLAILVMTVVGGLGVAGDFSGRDLAFVALKAVGFWLALMALGIVLARHIFRFLDMFRVGGATLGLALAMAFLAAGLAETFGLAMIIGAYSIGLALSRTPLAQRVQEHLSGVYNTLVPVFFVVMGMMVDVRAMGGAEVFGAVITVLAILSKVIGAGAPSMLVGFNRVGAWRIGLGMLPRGEVALIIAGVGLSSGAIGPDFFGVAILMTIITTLIAPILLMRAFDHGGSGSVAATRKGG